MILLGASRWLHTLALMTLLGNAALAALLPAPPTAGRWRMFAAPLAMLFAGVWFVLTAQQMAGQADAAALRAVLTQSLFGQVFAVRMVLLLLLCLAVILRVRDGLIAALAGAALALIAVTSHGAEASPAGFTAIGVIADGLHLLTAGFWLGGLTLLAGLLGASREDIGPAVRVFSQWAMIAVAVLLLTGMLNAANILLGGDAPASPLYAGVLAAKLVLVAAMLGLALFNQSRLLPRLPEAHALRRLHRHVRWELGLGTIVLALAAALSLLPPAL